MNKSEIVTNLFKLCRREAENLTQFFYSLVLVYALCVSDYAPAHSGGHEVPLGNDLAGLCASGVGFEFDGRLDHHGQDS